jgi:hypothetical protein
MGIFFLAVQTIRRAAGRSATAAAAYRSAERIRDARTGETFDFRRRQGVVDTGLIGWNGSRSSLWNAAELAERKRNAVVARELVVALPHELSPTERRRITAEFAGWLCLRHSTAADWALHEPPKGGDARAHHAHLMITVRRVDMVGAFGEKTRERDVRQFGRGHLEAWREKWAELCSEALRQRGLPVIDHRSHVRQAQANGMPEVLPQVKLGAAAARLERKGVQTMRGDENRRRSAFNAPVLRWRADAEAVVKFVRVSAATDDECELSRPLPRTRVRE